MAKKKEKSSEEIRLEKMKERINKIKKEQKLKEDLEKKEEELRELRKKENIKKNNTPLLSISKTSGLSNISPLNSNVFSEKPKSLTGVRNPINDTEKMWVESWWENRKTLDPNFDIDNWFKSSVHMDLKDRNKQIEDFWTGRANQNTDDFWTGPTMWAREKMI